MSTETTTLNGLDRLAQASGLGIANLGVVQDYQKQVAEYDKQRRKRANILESDITGNRVTRRTFLPPAMQTPLHLQSVINNDNGYARPNRFFVEFTFPRTLSKFDYKDLLLIGKTDNEASYDITKFGVLCQSVSLPQKMLQTYEHKQLGVPYKVPHTITYDNISFTFLCTNKMDVRRFFDDWHRSIVDDETMSLEFYDNYVANIKVHILDVEGNSIYVLEFIEAYPIALSNLDLSHSTNNSLLLSTVTMSYVRYKEEQAGGEWGIKNSNRISADHSIKNKTYKWIK